MNTIDTRLSDRQGVEPAPGIGHREVDDHDTFRGLWELEFLKK